jgi:hypothetical protein
MLRLVIDEGDLALTAGLASVRDVPGLTGGLNL